MRGKPNALWHMTSWGFVSGTILALLYIMFVGGLTNVTLLTDKASLEELLITLVTPSFWAIAALFGGVPGLVMGFLDGIVLWLITRKTPYPFTSQVMEFYRQPVYIGMGGITAGISSGLIFILLGWRLPFDLRVLLLYFSPALIAAIAAAYVGHRYLFRLRLWSEKHYGIRKEKEKRDTSHLEENFSKDVDFEDEEMSHEDSLKR